VIWECPRAGLAHRVRLNDGTPWCLTCDVAAVPVDVEAEAPPPADPAALVDAIRAVLDDPLMDDTAVVRAIEALLRVAP